MLLSSSLSHLLMKGRGGGEGECSVHVRMPVGIAGLIVVDVTTRARAVTHPSRFAPKLLTHLDNQTPKVAIVGPKKGPKEKQALRVLAHTTLPPLPPLFPLHHQRQTTKDAKHDT